MEDGRPVRTPTTSDVEAHMVVKSATLPANYRVDRHGNIILDKDRDRDGQGQKEIERRREQQGEDKQAPAQNGMTTPPLSPSKGGAVDKLEGDSGQRRASVRTPSRAEKKQWKIKRKRLVRDQSRELKWLKMVSSWQAFSKRNPAKVKSRIRKGIPESVRRFIWPELAGMWRFRGEESKGYYRELLSRPLPDASDIQIKKDLPRTRQDSILFRSPEPGSRDIVCDGQVSLYNIFKAYALHDPEIGYVQGMGSLIVPFLMFMPEEQSFWMLVTVLNNEQHNLAGLYQHNFPLAHKHLSIFDSLFHSICPALATHLDGMGLRADTYAFRWIMTRFSRFPMPLVLRLLDIYLHEGMKILYRFAIYVMQNNKEALMRTQDIGEALPILLNAWESPRWHDTDACINGAIAVPLTRAQIATVAERYDKKAREDGDPPPRKPVVLPLRRPSVTPASPVSPSSPSSTRSTSVPRKASTMGPLGVRREEKQRQEGLSDGEIATAKRARTSTERNSSLKSSVPGGGEGEGRITDVEEGEEEPDVDERAAQ